jgi:hypothetical protein
MSLCLKGQESGRGNHFSYCSIRPMPYEEHPIYVTPLDDTAIWRYMEFARFVQLMSPCARSGAALRRSP